MLGQLTKHKISSDIQALVFEINLRKEKWFFLSIYKMLYFLDSLHNIIDFYSGIYDNHIVLGDFNMDLLIRNCQHSWNIIITTVLEKTTLVL